MCGLYCLWFNMCSRSNINGYDKFGTSPCLGAFCLSWSCLGGLGIYQPLVDFANAGASIPLTDLVILL